MATIVFFNIQTTGLKGPHHDIVSIGALAVGGGRFSSFIRLAYPERSIARGATLHHGLSKGNNGQLLLRGQPVPACSQVKALADFLSFMWDARRHNGGFSLVLVSHTHASSVVLANCLVRRGMAWTLGQGRLRSTFFADSCQMAREALPGLPGYALGSLLWTFFGQEQTWPARAGNCALCCLRVVREVARRKGVRPADVIEGSRKVTLYSRVVRAERRLGMISY